MPGSLGCASRSFPRPPSFHVSEAVLTGHCLPLALAPGFQLALTSLQQPLPHHPQHPPQRKVAASWQTGIPRLQLVVGENGQHVPKGSDPEAPQGLQPLSPWWPQMGPSWGPGSSFQKDTSAGEQAPGSREGQSPQHARWPVVFQAPPSVMPSPLCGTHRLIL